MSVTLELSQVQQARQQELYDALYNMELPIPTMGWNPSINRILVLPQPAAATTKAGIIIPDSAKEKPEFGIVLTVGPGRMLENGQIAPLAVEIGDKVQFSKHAGAWVYDDTLDLMVLLMLDLDCLLSRPQKFLLATAPDDLSQAITAAERGEALPQAKIQ